MKKAHFIIFFMFLLMNKISVAQKTKVCISEYYMPEMCITYYMNYGTCVLYNITSTDLIQFAYNTESELRIKVDTIHEYHFLKTIDSLIKIDKQIQHKLKPNKIKCKYTSDVRLVALVIYPSRKIALGFNGTRIMFINDCSIRCNELIKRHIESFLFNHE